MEEIWKKLEISRLVGPPYDGGLLLTKIYLFTLDPSI
jgi:hypothetical protein